MRLSFETLDLPEAADRQIVAYLPADPAIKAAPAELGRPAPGALRVVRG